MSKKLRNFYIIGALFLAFFIYEAVKGYLIKDQTQSLEFEESFKEANLGGSSVEYLDSITMIYSNYKYGFSMDFPDNWTTDRGVSEHTVIRGVNIDSAMSFAINVLELTDMKDSGITLWTLWDNAESGMAESYRNMLSQSVNTTISNYVTRKVYVDNREAIEARFNYITRGVDYEFEVQSVVYSLYFMPYMYTVGLNVPKIFYEPKRGYYDMLITKFKIIRPGSIKSK